MMMVDLYSGQEGKRKNQLLSGVELRQSDWESSEGRGGTGFCLGAVAQCIVHWTPSHFA